MNDVVGVVLAGGIGKRFWPLTGPKPLVDFLGKSLLVHNLEALKSAGIRRVLIVVPATEPEFVLPNIAGLQSEIVRQTRPLGMADAYLAAAEKLSSQACLVLNATDVVEDSFYKTLRGRLSENQMFIVGKAVSEYTDVGYLRLDGNKVTGIVEKPGKGKEPSRYVNFVFDYFPDPAAFTELVKATKSAQDDVYEKALTKLLQRQPATLMTYSGFWQPLKYPWQILDILDYFLKQKLAEHRGKNVEIKDNVFIDGPVWLGDNVKILENTKIVGPCYIGANTVIGNNNVIRYSQIGENCVTGFNTDITRSFVGPNSWFHSNYVGDSVLEGNVGLGSGTVLANLRLDEGEIFSLVQGKRLGSGRNKLGAVIGRDTRIGVNTSIMPGVKIGGKSLVGAGLVIDKDIPDNSFCLGKTDYKTEKNVSSVSRKNREEFRLKL